MPLTATADPLAEGLAASLEDFDPEMASLVLDELTRGWQVDNVLAAVRQNNIAQATNRIEWAAIDGIGEVTMRLDPAAYHYWGQRLGYDCWHDAAFKREFLRDNPAAGVHRRHQKATVMAPGPSLSLSPRQSAPSSPQPTTTSPRPTTTATLSAAPAAAATSAGTTVPRVMTATPASPAGAASISTQRIILP